MLTQILKGFTHSVRHEPKSTVGNTGRVSVDGGMWRCRLQFFYVLFKCLRNIWGFKHKLWLILIIDGLWRRNKELRNKDNGICQLTFRLVIVSHWLRNLLLSNVCKENVSIRIGNTGNTFVAGKVSNAYLCPYSDLWASCPIYLCEDTEILGLH